MDQDVKCDIWRGFLYLHHMISGAYCLGITARRERERRVWMTRGEMLNYEIYYVGLYKNIMDWSCSFYSCIWTTDLDWIRCSRSHAKLKPQTQCMPNFSLKTALAVVRESELKLAAVGSGSRCTRPLNSVRSSRRIKLAPVAGDGEKALARGKSWRE